MLFPHPIHKFDLRFLTHYYRLSNDGVLYRILATGEEREISSLSNGLAYLTYGGKRYKAAEAAWALQHGQWPAWPIWLIDGNPFNFKRENMLAVRTGAKRCRIVTFDGFYYHPMDVAGFTTHARAVADWHKRVTAVIVADQPMVYQLMAVARRQFEAGDGNGQPVLVSDVARKPKKRYKRPDPRPVRPKDVPGHKWHWYEQEWLLVPQSCHVADDYRERCHAVKYLGATRFYYDKEQERVLFETNQAPQSQPSAAPA